MIPFVFEFSYVRDFILIVFGETFEKYNKRCLIRIKVDFDSPDRFQEVTKILLSLKPHVIFMRPSVAIGLYSRIIQELSLYVMIERSRAAMAAIMYFVRELTELIENENFIKEKYFIEEKFVPFDEATNFTIEKSDTYNGIWKIRDVRTDCYYLAGSDETNVRDLLSRLNKAHRPNIAHTSEGLCVCWNTHDKDQACDYVLEIPNNRKE